MTIERNSESVDLPAAKYKIFNKIVGIYQIAERTWLIVHWQWLPDERDSTCVRLRNRYE